MIMGVLQQLRIVRHDAHTLILREFPLLEYVFIGALLLGTVNMAIFNLWVSAVAALIIAIIWANLSRIRDIVFDADNMRVIFRYPLHQQIPITIPLNNIQRAHLQVADDGSTQIILVTTQGEMGLSVYSRDMRVWKEDVVFAINAFLSAHRTDDAHTD